MTTTPIRGQIVIYKDGDLHGEFRPIFNDCADLGSVGFENVISSFVIISGNWKFYEDSNYVGQYAPVLGPGVYRSITDAGIPNDRISSLKC